MLVNISWGQTSVQVLVQILTRCMVLEIYSNFSMSHEDDDDNDDAYHACKLVGIKHLGQLLVLE